MMKPAMNVTRKANAVTAPCEAGAGIVKCRYQGQISGGEIVEDAERRETLCSPAIRFEELECEARHSTISSAMYNRDGRMRRRTEVVEKNLKRWKLLRSSH